jgi:hypothetical protein
MKQLGSGTRCTPLNSGILVCKTVAHSGQVVTGRLAASVEAPASVKTVRPSGSSTLTSVIQREEALHNSRMRCISGSNVLSLRKARSW